MELKTLPSTKENNLNNEQTEKMSQVIIDVEQSIKRLVETMTASIGEVIKLVQEQNRETRQCLLMICLSKDSNEESNGLK